MSIAEEDMGFGIGAGILIGVLVMVLIFSAVNEDNVDIDDTLAPYMCAQHGLIVEDVEFSFYEEVDGVNTKQFSMQITCKEEPIENITSIDDGYLILKV